MHGFGLSSKPADYDYRGANQALMIGKFIRALGFEKTIIGGHSLGGALALRVAVKDLETQMKESARNLMFEKAAQLRDEMYELRRILALEEKTLTG